MTKIFLTCQWKNLAMVNFEIDPELLLAFVPAGTELDLFDGKAFVTLLGFQYQGARVKGWRVPGHEHFSEINLRFYVKRKVGGEWRRGVCFIKELVGLPAVACVANVCYGESFETVCVSSHLERQGSEATIRYTVATPGRAGILSMSASAEKKPVLAGTVEDFIVTHLWAYSALRNGQTLEYMIHRPEWRFWPVQDVCVDLDLERLYGPVLGKVLRGQWHSAFWVDGSAVEVQAPQKIPFTPRSALVIFDGVCHLCNGSVDFLLRHDRRKNFLLLTNQTGKANKILSVFGFQEKANDSVYLIQGGRIYRESTAALRILKILGFPFCLWYVLIVVPSFLRNLVYRFVARNRYRWFGKRETCRLLPPQE